MIEKIFAVSTLLVSAIPLMLLLIKIRKKIESHPYSVEAIFIASFILFYFLDTLYSIISYRNTFNISGLQFYFTSTHFLALSLYYCLTAAAVAALLSFKSKERDKQISKNIRKTSATISHPIPLNISRFLIYSSLIWLAGQIHSYGFTEYFQNLAVRALVFSETTTENALISAAISIYSLIISCRYASNPKFIRLTIDSIPLLAAIALTGARATLVEFAFIFLFINNYHSNTFKFNKKTIAIVAISAIALTQFAMSTRTHSDENISGLFSTIFETEQVPQSENGINILERDSQESTIPTSLMAFLPRSLLEAVNIDKGHGGNAAYTEEFVPYRWIDQNSQLSLGGLNELIYNGNAVLAFFTAIAGALLARLTLSASSRSSLFVFLTPAISWSAFQFLRGDLYHTVNKITTYITALLLFAAIVKIVTLIRATHRKPHNEKSANYRPVRL